MNWIEFIKLFLQYKNNELNSYMFALQFIHLRRKPKVLMCKVLYKQPMGQQQGAKGGGAKAKIDNIN